MGERAKSIKKMEVRENILIPTLAMGSEQHEIFLRRRITIWDRRWKDFKKTWKA